MLKRVLATLAILLAPLLFMPSVLAVDVTTGVCDNPRAKGSAVCEDTDVGNNNPIFGPNGILTLIINILSIVVGIVAVIMIILAGLKFVSSGSNPQEVANARERLIYAVVGLIIASLAQVLVRFVINKAGQ